MKTRTHIEDLPASSTIGVELETAALELVTGGRAKDGEWTMPTGKMSSATSNGDSDALSIS